MERFYCWIPKQRKGVFRIAENHFQKSTCSIKKSYFLWQWFSILKYKVYLIFTLILFMVYLDYVSYYILQISIKAFIYSNNKFFSWRPKHTYTVFYLSEKKKKTISSFSKSSFNNVITQVLRCFKACSRCVGTLVGQNL